MTFKNIRIKMKSGKSRTQRVKVLASGKYKFVKNLTSKVRKSKKRRKKSNPKRRRRYLGRRRKKRKGGKSLSQQVFKWIRVGALVAPAVGEALAWRGQPQDIPAEIIKDYTGYKYTTGEFQLDWLARGWTPYLMACLTTYGIPKLAGLIRRL